MASLRAALLLLQAVTVAEIQAESQQKQMKATSTVSSMPLALMNSIIFMKLFLTYSFLM